MSKNIKENPVTNTTVIGFSFIKQLINRKILLIFKNFVKSLEGDVTSSFIILLTYKSDIFIIKVGFLYFYKILFNKGEIL